MYETLRNGREALDVKVRKENPTDLPLAEVFFGIVGGHQGISERQGTESLVPGMNSNLAPAAFTAFQRFRILFSRWPIWAYATKRWVSFIRVKCQWDGLSFSTVRLT